MIIIADSGSTKTEWIVGEVADLSVITKGINPVRDTKEEILEAVAEMAKKCEPGEWIQGLGWNQSGWVDTTMPTRQELDTVSPENPVLLVRGQLVPNGKIICNAHA